MVENILKLTIQTEKINFLGFKYRYSKIVVKNAATLIIAPTVERYRTLPIFCITKQNMKLNRLGWKRLAIDDHLQVHDPNCCSRRFLH